VNIDMGLGFRSCVNFIFRFVGSYCFVISLLSFLTYQRGEAGDQGAAGR
jgi:hypothetical protein